jgi:hypothetical protein
LLKLNKQRTARLASTTHPRSVRADNQEHLPIHYCLSLRRQVCDGSAAMVLSAGRVSFAHELRQAMVRPEPELGRRAMVRSEPELRCLKGTCAYLACLSEGVAHLRAPAPTLRADFAKLTLRTCAKLTLPAKLTLWLNRFH